jgi:hypothetical protein
MAFKMTNSPITAKIKRTTQGGMITEPLLDLGSVAKMKADSPAKNRRNRASNNEARRKSRQLKAQKAADLKAQKANELKTKKTISNKRGRQVPNPDYVKPTKTSGSDYTPVRTDNSNPVPFPFRQDATLNGGSKSGVKGAMGSDRRKAEYDKRNWAYDETISTKSLKAKQKPAKKATASNIAPKPAKVAKVGTKPNNELVTSAPKPKSKKEVRVAKSVDRKTNKASKVRAKGEAALASGNVSKARRLKRREERLKKRAAKKASK